MAVIDLSVRDNISAAAKAAADALNKVADAADKAADSTTKVNTTTSAALPSFDSVNKRLDEQAGLTAKVEAANRKFEASVASLRAEASKNADVQANLSKLEANAASDRDAAIQKATEYAAALKKSRGALDEHTLSTGASKQAQRQLEIQAIQTVSGIASGQPVLLTLIQQGHQIWDTFLSAGGGLSAFGTAAKGLFDALGGWKTLGIGLFAGALFEVFSRAGELEHQAQLTAVQLKGMGLSADISTASVKALSDSLRAVGVDAKDQGSIIQALNKTTLSETQRQQVTDTSLNLSAITGDSATQTIPIVAQVSQGSFDAIRKLDDQLGFLSVTDRQIINDLEKMNDRAGAATLAMSKLGDATTGAFKNAQTSGQAATTALSTAFQSLLDAVANSTPVKAVSNAGAALLQGTANQINAGAAPLNAISDFGGAPLLQAQEQEQAAAAKQITDEKTLSDAQTKRAADQLKAAHDLNDVLAKQTDISVAQTANDGDQLTKLQALAIAGKNNLDNTTLEVVQRGLITAEIIKQTAALEHQIQVNNDAVIAAYRSTMNFPGGYAMDPTDGQVKRITKTKAEIAGDAAEDQARSSFSTNNPQFRATLNIDAPFGATESEVQKLVDAKAEEKETQERYFRGINERARVEAEASGANSASLADRANYNNAQVFKLKPAARGPATARLATDQQLIDTSQGSYDENGVVHPTTETGKSLVKSSAALAQAQASDSTVQANAGIDRAIVQQTKLAEASKLGTAAVLAQTIANQAAETAATSYGVSVAALTAKLTEKGAREENAKVTGQITEMQAAIDINKELAAATTDQEAHTASLDVKSANLTNTLKDYAALLSGPEKAALEATIANMRNIVELTDKQANDIANNNSARGSQKQIDYLQKEVELRGQTAEQQAVELARFKTLQDLETSQGADPMHLTETQQHLIDVNGKLADTTYILNKQKAAAQELSDAFGNAFDQVGQNITQAFTQGNAAALSFGSIAKGVISSLMSQFVKLAIVNPLSNAVFSTDKNTLLDAFNGLSSGTTTNSGGGSNLSSGGGTTGTTTSGGSGGGLSTLSNLGSGASSLSSAFGGPSFSSALSSAGNYVGLTNGAGSFTAPGSFLGQSTNIGAQAMTVDGSTVMAGGQTLGAALASGAAGFSGGVALGSLVGTGEQHLLNKTGPAPMIGAAGGAALMIGAAALAPETLGLSLLVAGLIGGTAGGALGGLIGPRPQSTYSTTALDMTKGTLQVGQTHAQNVDAKAQVDFLHQQVDQLNKFVMDNKIAITGQNAPIQIGANNPGGFQDPSKYEDLNTANVTGATAFSHYTFSAQDPIENDKLKDKTFANETEFGTWVDNFNTIQASAKSFLTGTAAVMKQAGAVTGSYNDTMANINKTFDDADTSAKTMLNSDKLSEQQTKDVTKAENDLAGVRAKLTKQTIDQKNAQIQSGSDTLMAGILSDRAQLQRNPGLSAKMTVDAQLFAFDKQVPVLKQQFDDGWKQIFGEDFASMKEYQDQLKLFEEKSYDDRLVIAEQYNKQIEDQQKQLAKNVSGITARYLSAKGANDNNPAEALQSQFVSYDAQAAQEREDMITAYTTAGESADALAKAMDGLTKTQEEERKQIQNAFDDKLKQSATASIVSLTQYAQKLESGSNSPLSPTAQLDSARTKFDQQRALALGGDSNALNNLSSYSDSFLAASKSVYGSGSQYVADFQKVLDTLTTISTTSPDTLTASVLATETRTQTQALQDSLKALQDELVAIKLEIKTGGSTPAQLAAA